MQTRSKIGLPAAICFACLFAANANAQTAGTADSATPPAAATPAAPAEADSKAKTTPDAADSAKADTANSSDDRASNRRRWRRDRSERRSSAYHRHGTRSGGMEQRRRWRNLSDADRKAYFEARLASIRAGLMMNEAQARLWPSVETAVREMAAKRQEWRERIKKEGRPANPFDRMKRRGDLMADRAAGLQKFANAAKPLYDSLSDDQKRRLRVLTRGVRKMIRHRQMQRGHRMQGMHR